MSDEATTPEAAVSYAAVGNIDYEQSGAPYALGPWHGTLDARQFLDDLKAIGWTVVRAEASA